jgi:hypothetical protein
MLLAAHSSPRRAEGCAAKPRFRLAAGGSVAACASQFLCSQMYQAPLHWACHDRRVEGSFVYPNRYFLLLQAETSKVGVGAETVVVSAPPTVGADEPTTTSDEHQHDLLYITQWAGISSALRILKWRDQVYLCSCVRVLCVRVYGVSVWRTRAAVGLVGWMFVPQTVSREIVKIVNGCPPPCLLSDFQVDRVGHQRPSLRLKVRPALRPRPSLPETLTASLRCQACTGV